MREVCSTDTSEHKDICDSMKKGDLVPDDFLLKVLKTKLAAVFKKYNSIILDGFPRTYTQAKLLDRLLFEEHALLTDIIFLEVPEEIIFQRIGRRKICDVYFIFFLIYLLNSLISYACTNVLSISSFCVFSSCDFILRPNRFVKRYIKTPLNNVNVVQPIFLKDQTTSQR